MDLFSKKNLAQCPNCGEMKPTNATPQQIEEGAWECQDCYNRSGKDREEERSVERGQKEISKYDPEYEFLVKLVKLVTKEGIPPEEIRNLANAYPFQTIDDVGDLAAKIWTLATQKYQIPAEWLEKKMGKQASLKKSKSDSGYVDNDKGYTCGRCAYFDSKNEKCALVQGTIKAQGCCNFWNNKVVEKSDKLEYTKKEAVYIEYPNVDYRCDECAFFDAKNKKCSKVEGEISPSASCNLWQPITKKEADLWPAQEEAEDMLNHAPGYIAYEYGQDKESVFSGAEFSTDDIGTAPSIDPGPFSSPEDHGAKPQKSPFPNTNWLPADDDNKDEQPASNVASSQERPFSKKASLDSRYWLSPDGKVFDAGTHHGAWVKHNMDVLKEYGIDPRQNLSVIYNEMFETGWTRVSNERGFTVQVADLRHVPGYLDNFIAANFTPGDIIRIGTETEMVEVSDPFPSIQRAINKQLMNTKQADLSGQTVNQILNLVHQNGGVTYNMSQGDMSGTNNFAVSAYPNRSQILEDGVDFDRLEEYLETNRDVLTDANNSLGVWTHDSKVYLDIVVTIPNYDEAVDLAKKHNQIAIWDLRNNNEIPTGGTGEPTQAFSKTDMIKQSEEQLLSQEDQDQIAANSSPAYVIAVNNYAEALKRGHGKDRSLEYAIESVANIDKIDAKKLVEIINTYL